MQRHREARRARRLKGRLKRGDLLKEVLGDAETDDFVGRAKVSEDLQALPKLGKVTALNIMIKARHRPPDGCAAWVLVSAAH